MTKKTASLILLAVGALAIGSAFAAPKTLLTCVPAKEARGNSALRQLILTESDLKGRIEVEMIRADGTSELTGIGEDSLDLASTADQSTPILLQSGHARVLKKTGAYTNLEVLSLARSKGKMYFFQGRTCDPTYQEEEGCLDSSTVIEETSFQLDCK